MGRKRSSKSKGVSITKRQKLKTHRRSLKRRLRSNTQRDGPYTAEAVGPINYMPAEVMLNIFSWLSPADLTNIVPPVCKRWHELALIPHLWKKLSFKRGTANTIRLCDRLRISSQLKALQLIDRQDADVILREVCRSNAQLEELWLIRCQGTPGRWEVSGDLMARVIRSCPKLSILVITGSTMCYSPAFKRSLLNKKLQYIAVPECSI